MSEKPTLAEQMRSLLVGQWLYLPREFRAKHDVQRLINECGGGAAWVMRENRFTKRRSWFQIRRAGEGEQ